MNRKEFLKNSVQTCLVCCGAMAGLSSLAAQNLNKETKLSADLGKRMLEGAKSPDWRKVEKSLSWIKNMLDHMDEQLDEETRIKLLNACGRSCYIYAQGVADDRKISNEQAEGFLHALESDGYKIERTKEKTIIYFGYKGEQNPQGLSLKEGYCLCPIVESDLSYLSPSYCNCSAGYVKEIIERNTGWKVKRVDVLESIKRGGKDCRFKAEILNL